MSAAVDAFFAWFRSNPLEGVFAVDGAILLWRFCWKMF